MAEGLVFLNINQQPMRSCCRPKKVLNLNLIQFTRLNIKCIQVPYTFRLKQIHKIIKAEQFLTTEIRSMRKRIYGKNKLAFL